MAEAAPTLKKRGSFVLFQNQVAGHLPLLSSHGAIFKPAFPVEVAFYRDVEEKVPQLMPFIPQYLELISMANAYVKTEEPQEDSKEPKPNDFAYTLLESSQAKLSKLDNQYLVLQDLTHGYKRPCILDIKLGTRQHGIHDGPRKVASKTRKVNTTTSKDLGLRLCGMQLYQDDKNEFVCSDKYFGRHLSRDTLFETIDSFFRQGTILHTRVIHTILERLHGLATVLEEQTQFVFIACSVLILYDRAVQSNDTSIDAGHVDVRLIDFAHTYPVSDLEESIETGTVFGVRTLIDLLESILHKEAE